MKRSSAGRWLVGYLALLAAALLIDYLLDIRRKARPMRIDEALGEIKPLDVKFGTGAVLHIKYQPMSYTVAEIEAAAADKDNPKRLIETLQRTVVEWDLLDSSGEPIDIADFEAIRTQVPLPIYRGIIEAIRDDNSAGEA